MENFPKDEVSSEVHYTSTYAIMQKMAVYLNMTSQVRNNAYFISKPAGAQCANGSPGTVVANLAQAIPLQ